MSAPKGPFHLVSVNTAPERAKRLIGRVAEALSDARLVNQNSPPTTLNMLTLAVVDVDDSVPIAQSLGSTKLRTRSSDTTPMFW
jgi:hypothetical protein